MISANFYFYKAMCINTRGLGIQYCIEEQVPKNISDEGIHNNF